MEDCALQVGLNEREIKLREKKEELQQGYKRKDEIGGDFFDRKDVAESGFLTGRERDEEAIDRRKTFIRLVGNESEIIRKELSEIEKYNGENESNARKNRITDMIKSKQRQQGEFFFPCEEDYKKQCRYEIKDDDIPYFILKNTQSMDTIYRTFSTIGYTRLDDFHAEDYDHGVILVGGFVKLKELEIGQNFVCWKHYGGFNPEIASVWDCIDVSITEEESYMKYWYDDKYTPVGRDAVYSEIVSLTLRNKKKPDLIDYVRYSHIIKSESVGNHLINRITNEKTFKQYELAFNRQKQENNKLVIQEKAKRKQELTAKYGAANADKIIAGKFEIGMSKAVCKEIAGYATVADKTSTTETWRVSNIFWGGATYLFFEGDKLARIVNR